MAARGLQLLVSSHPPSRTYLVGAALAATAAGAGVIASALHALGVTAGVPGPDGVVPPDAATKALVLVGAAAPIVFWAARVVVARRFLPDLVLLLLAVPVVSAALAAIGVTAPAGPFAYTGVVGGLAALAWLRRPGGVYMLEGGLRVANRTILWRDVRGYSTLALDHYWNGLRIGSTYRANVLLNDGAWIQLAPGVTRAAPLCDALEATLGARLWRDATERLSQGAEAPFGAITLDAEGIRLGRRRLGWIETRAATLERDHLCIHARGQSRPWARLRKRDLTAPNVAWRVIDARVTSPTAFADATRAQEAAAASEAAALASLAASSSAAEVTEGEVVPAVSSIGGATALAAAAAAVIREDAGRAVPSDASLDMKPTTPYDFSGTSPDELPATAPKSTAAAPAADQAAPASRDAAPAPGDATPAASDPAPVDAPSGSVRASAASDADAVKDSTPA